MYTTLNLLKKNLATVELDILESLLKHLNKTEYDDEIIQLSYINNVLNFEDMFICILKANGKLADFKQLAFEFILKIKNINEIPKIVNEYFNTNNEKLKQEAANSAYLKYAELQTDENHSLSKSQTLLAIATYLDGEYTDSMRASLTSTYVLKNNKYTIELFEPSVSRLLNEFNAQPD